jgi:hypothetical protein
MGSCACRKMVGLIRLCPCPWWLLDVLCDGARYGPDPLKEGIATWNTPVLEAAAARKLGGQKRTSWEQFLQTQFSD